MEVKRLTEDDACHGSGETKLLLEILGSECDEAVDKNSIEGAIEHEKHVRTVGDQGLNSPPYFC